MTLDLLTEGLELLRARQTPVVYIHAEPAGPPRVALVDPEWLATVWAAAVGPGGYKDPSLTDAGRAAQFMPHEHVEPG